MDPATIIGIIVLSILAFLILLKKRGFLGDIAHMILALFRGLWLVFCHIYRVIWIIVGIVLVIKFLRLFG